VPLFRRLRPLRHTATTDTPTDDVPRAALPLRAASLAISLAGAFYLVQALRRA
jgi:hypothetical protein